MQTMIVYQKYVALVTLSVLLAAGCSDRSGETDANRPTSGPVIEEVVVAPVIEDIAPVRLAQAPAATPTPTATQPATAPAPQPKPAPAPATRPTTTKPASRPAATPKPAPNPATAPATMPATMPAGFPTTTTPAIAPESDPNFFIAAGDRALAADDANKAVTMMYRAVELDPTRLASLRGLAISLVAGRRFNETVPIYDSILAMDPNDQTARFNLALALSRVRDFGRAEKEYRTVLAKDDNYAEARYNLAMLYQTQGKLQYARQAWLKVIEQAPKLSSARNMLGELYMDLGKPVEAMDCFAEATKLKPDEVASWLNLATAARQAGSYGRAMVAIHRAEDLAPQDGLVQYRRGELLLELHRTTEKPELLADAISAWRKSLKLDPTQTELRDKLARLVGPETAPATGPATKPTAP